MECQSRAGADHSKLHDSNWLLKLHVMLLKLHVLYAEAACVVAQRATTEQDVQSRKIARTTASRSLVPTVGSLNGWKGA